MRLPEDSIPAPALSSQACPVIGSAPGFLNFHGCTATALGWHRTLLPALGCTGTVRFKPRFLLTLGRDNKKKSSTKSIFPGSFAVVRRPSEESHYQHIGCWYRQCCPNHHLRHWILSAGSPWHTCLWYRAAAGHPLLVSDRHPDSADCPRGRDLHPNITVLYSI